MSDHVLQGCQPSQLHRQLPKLLKPSHEPHFVTRDGHAKRLSRDNTGRGKRRHQHIRDQKPTRERGPWGPGQRLRVKIQRVWKGRKGHKQVSPDTQHTSKSTCFQHAFYVQTSVKKTTETHMKHSNLFAARKKKQRKQRRRRYSLCFCVACRDWPSLEVSRNRWSDTDTQSRSRQNNKRITSLVKTIVWHFGATTVALPNRPTSASGAVPALKRQQKKLWPFGMSLATLCP